MLAEKYHDRIQQIFAKYPDRRSAIMGLLYIAQEEYGWVTPEAVDEIATLIGTDRTQVDSIAGFYTMYRESPKGKYWLQVCTDLPCALRGAEEFYKELLDYLGIQDGETTTDGLFTVDHVTCLAACHRAPMLQCNFHYVENLNIDKVKALIEQWRAEAQAAPSQPVEPAAKKPAGRSKRTKAATS